MSFNSAHGPRSATMFLKKVSSLLQATKGEETIVGALKKITVKDAVYWVAGLRDEITSETLLKSWDKMLKNESTESDNHGIDEDDLPLFNLLKKIPGCKNTNMAVVEEWINSYEELEFTDADIVKMINVPVVQDDSEEENPTDSTPLISNSEGLAVLESAMRYMEQQPEATPVDNMLFRQWCDIASRKRSDVFKQNTIDNY